jgi:hypothetical protein
MRMLKILSTEQGWLGESAGSYHVLSRWARIEALGRLEIAHCSLSVSYIPATPAAMLRTMPI